MQLSWVEDLHKTLLFIGIITLLAWINGQIHFFVEAFPVSRLLDFVLVSLTFLRSNHTNLYSHTFQYSFSYNITLN